MKTTRLLVLLIASLFCLCKSALAQEDNREAYAVLDDNGLLKFYYNENKPSSGAYDIPWVNNPRWYQVRENILSVAFDASFSSYRLESASQMFSNCNNLASIDFANFNTENVTNMSYMFLECSSLTSLDVSNLNTSNVTNMTQMFSNCSALEELFFSKDGAETVFNTSSVTSMSSMFYGCASLKELDLSSFNTSSVTSMSSMFYECTLLKKLDLSSFNTSSVTSMSSMFYGCTSLKMLDLSNFNTMSVTDMSSMFYGCTILDELDLSNFNTSSVKYMSNMFQGCAELTSLDLSSFSTIALIQLNAMFQDCSKLKYLDIRNFSISGDVLAEYMFSDCSSLEEILCLNTWYPSGKYNLNNYNSLNMFSGCTNLKGGKGSVYNTSYLNFQYAHPDGGTYEDRPSAGYFTDGKPYAILSGGTLTFYYDLKMNTRSGVSFVFPADDSAPGWTSSEYVSSITTVTFDESVIKFTELTAPKLLLSGLSSLTTINNLDNLPTANFTDLSEMFKGCSSLTSLDLSGLNTENVTNMSHMFEGCIGLTNLDLSELNTENVTDISYMFKGCSSLESQNLVLPNINIYYYDSEYHLTDISHMFEDCSGLTSIDVSKINTAYVTNMSYMFSGCRSLTSLDLYDFQTSKVEDMSFMFNGCSSLEFIYCYNNWANGAVSNSENMFAGCSNLPEFNSNEVTVAKANPTNGYFSVKKEAYAYIDGNSLIFCYDTHMFEKEGGVFPVMEEPDENPEWDEEWAQWRYGSEGVTEVIFDPSFDDFRPKSTSYWFYGMRRIESFVGLEYLHTEAVTDMSGMFYGCEKLTSLDLTSFDVSNVTVMNNMFAYCSSLEMIYAEDWSGVVCESENMFAGCENLPNWNEDNSNDINFAKPSENGGYFSTKQAYAIVENANLTFYYDGYNFEGTCSIDQTAGGTWKTATFTTVTFDPSFADYKLTSTAGMFSGKTGLTTIYGLDYLNTTNISDMSNMFSGCSSLTTIYCDKDWSGLDVPSTGMFAGCTSLVGAISYEDNPDTEHKKDITYANPTNGYFSLKKDAYAYIDGNSLIFCYDTHMLERYEYSEYECVFPVKEEPEIDENSEWDEEWARWSSYSEEVTKVIFHPSFDDFRPKSTIGWFSSMSMVNSFVGLEYLHTEAVTDMSGMFIGCDNLTSLDLTSFKVSKVTDMSFMFAYCNSLEMIYAGDWSNINCKSEGMFAECYRLPGFIEDDSEDYDITWAKPKDDNGVGFFTQLNDILLYDSRSNTETINNSNGSVKVFLVDRTLYKTGDWNTLCLPFSLTAEQLAASPLAGYTELRTLSDAQYNAGTLTLNFTPATGDDAVTSIEAGKPYIIKWNSGENIVNPTFTGVTISSTLSPVVTPSVSFIGIYDPLPLTSANSNILYLGAGNTLYYPSANMTINSFRAYFELNLTSGQQVKAINLNFGDEENGIQEITTDSSTSNTSSTYFTLDGRRLNDKPATAGLYIHNGRKVLIK